MHSSTRDAEKKLVPRVLLAIGVVVLVAAVSAQVRNEPPPLGAVAKATADEKAKATKPATKTDIPAAKKYTNENLVAGGTSPAPRFEENCSNAEIRAMAKNERFWRSRAAPLLKSIRQLKSRSEMLTARLTGIKKDSERRGGLDALKDRVEDQIDAVDRERVDHERELEALRECGFQAGAPPEWFR